MPGSFGSSPDDDGAVAFTASSSQSGLFAHNDGAVAPPPGSPGGSGVFGLTAVPGAAGVFGACNHPSTGHGVQGNGPEAGVSGFSDAGVGVLAHSNHGDAAQTFAHSSDHNALLAMNDAGGNAPNGGAPAGGGVLAVTTVGGGPGVFGACNHGSHGRGVQGNGPEAGVGGFSEQGVGVLAQSNGGDGLQASTGSSAKSGVVGRNDSTAAASAPGGSGVFGLTLAPGATGVFGANNAPAGSAGRGVQGNGPEAGVGGFSEQGIGVLAQSGHIGIEAEAPLAGHFVGDVEVTGDIRLLGADCAEDFDAVDAGAAEPGTVMVLDDSGAVRVSDRRYDSRVAGVVSGAGTYRPALILDRAGPNGTRLPLALVGKVYCKVDATHAPIAVGDLLTTSSTPGHAMKAEDRSRAFGAVVGKALGACSADHGLIPILVTLQ